MKIHHRLLGNFFTLLIIASSAVGCAINPYINVSYKPSKPSHFLKGQQVYVDFQDTRSDKAFPGTAAQSHFRHFNGRFHLFIEQNNKPKAPIGSYDLIGLFKETLNLRLQNYGVRVLQTKSKDDLVMQIKMNEFNLNLKNSNWITSIAYSCRLVSKNSAHALENISVTVERRKIWGRKDAEKTINEAITDAVNKLDFPRLFEKIVR